MSLEGVEIVLKDQLAAVPTVRHVAIFNEEPPVTSEKLNAIYFALVETPEVIPYAGTAHRLLVPVQFIIYASSSAARDGLQAWMRTMWKRVGNSAGVTRMAELQEVGVTHFAAFDGGSRGLERRGGAGAQFVGEVTCTFGYQEVAPVADVAAN